MQPFVSEKHLNNLNKGDKSTNEDFNFEVSVLVAAKKVGLSFEELNLFSLNDFFDFLDMYIGENEEQPRQATQEDIDYFYRYL